MLQCEHGIGTLWTGMVLSLEVRVHELYIGHRVLEECISNLLCMGMNVWKLASV